MNPEELLSKLQAKGVQLRVSGEQLLCRPVGKLTSEEGQMLRLHKLAIMSLLRPMGVIPSSERQAPDKEPPEAVEGPVVSTEISAPVETPQPGTDAPEVVEEESQVAPARAPAERAADTLDVEVVTDLAAEVVDDLEDEFSRWQRQALGVSKSDQRPITRRTS